MFTRAAHSGAGRRCGLLPALAPCRCAAIPSKSTKRTCLVLQLIQPLSTLRDFCDVLPHDANGVVDLRLDGRSLRVTRASRVRRGAATGEVGVVRLRPAIIHVKRTLCGRFWETRVQGGKETRFQNIEQQAKERGPLTWLQSGATRHLR